MLRTVLHSHIETVGQGAEIEQVGCVLSSGEARCFERRAQRLAVPLPYSS